MDSLSCPAVPFSVHYFGSSPVNDMTDPGDMVCNCRSVHLGVRKAFLSALVLTLLLAISVSFLCYFSLLPRFLFFQCKHSHSCDMVSSTHICQCLLYYVCPLGVPESECLEGLHGCTYSIFPEILFTVSFKPLTYEITTGFLFNV